MPFPSTLLLLKLFQAPPIFAEHGVNVLAPLLANCHIKLIKGQLENETNTAITNFLWNANQFLHNSVVSILVMESPVLLENKNYQTTTHFTVCFVHLYLLYELSQKYRWPSILRIIMSTSHQSGEWPHHHIFLASVKFWEHGNVWFHRDILHRTFVRGLVLSMDCVNATQSNCTIYSICVFCRDPFKILEVNGETPLSNFARQSTRLWLSTDNRGIFVDELFEFEAWTIEYACNIFVPNIHKRFHGGLYFSICAFYLLRETYNFTFSVGKLSNVNKLAYFEATSSKLLAESNILYLKRNKMRTWVSHGLVVNPLKFTAFQKVPQLTSDTLILKPYDTPSWIFLLVSTISLALTMTPNRTISARIIFEHLVFLCIEQSVTFKWSPKANEMFAKRLQTFSWLLWNLVVIVMANGYKGEIFSLFATSVQVTWPRDIQELSRDPKYTKLTWETFYVMKDGSNKQFALLQALFDANPSDIFVRNAKMHKLLRHMPVQAFLLDHDEVFGEIIWQNKFLSPDEKTREYTFGNSSSSKFAIIYQSTDLSGVTNMLPKFSASDTLEIPGFSLWKPWLIYKNFLHDHFHCSLRRLEQAGFFAEFERHEKIDTFCGFMNATMQYLRRNYNLVNDSISWAAAVQRCFGKVMADYLNDGRNNNSSKPERLGFSRIEGVLKIAIVALVVSTGAFLIEKIIKIS